MARKIGNIGDDPAQMGLISIAASMLDSMDGRTMLNQFTRMEYGKIIYTCYRLVAERDAS